MAGCQNIIPPHCPCSILICIVRGAIKKFSAQPSSVQNKIKMVFATTAQMHKLFIAQKSHCACCVLSLATIRSKYYFNFILNRTRSGRELFDHHSYKRSWCEYVCLYVFASYSRLRSRVVRQLVWMTSCFWGWSGAAAMPRCSSSNRGQRSVSMRWKSSRKNLSMMMRSVYYETHR